MSPLLPRHFHSIHSHHLSVAHCLELLSPVYSSSSAARLLDMEVFLWGETRKIMCNSSR